MSQQAFNGRKQLFVDAYIDLSHKAAMLGIDTLYQEDWLQANYIYSQGSLRALGPKLVILNEIKEDALGIADDALLFMMHGTEES